MDVVAFVGAIGLGSVITVVVQSWLGRRTAQTKRSFDERKEAYVGLLQAYRRTAIEGTDEAAKEFAYWQMRCELVGSSHVCAAVQEIIDSNDDELRRNVAHTDLMQAMRMDIGVARK